MTRVSFNPPPGWPPPPPGWMPPIGWDPPADWPAAPEGWVLFLETPRNEPAARGNAHSPHHLPDDLDHRSATWWDDASSGYHSAYFTSRVPHYSRAPFDFLSPAGRTPSGATFDGRAPRSRAWLRRLLLGGAVMALLLLVVPLVNNPVSRAMNACEDAVHERAFTEQAVAAAPAGAAISVEPLSTARRAEMRYSVVESGSADTVKIAGDMQLPTGQWWTFTCAASHQSDPPRVLEVALNPVVPASSSTDSQWSRVP